MMRWDSALLAPVAVAALVSALVANLAVPLARELALLLRAVDTPGGRRQHAGEVARLGGLAIAAGVLAGVGTVALTLHVHVGAATAPSQAVALAAGAALVLLVGLAEDLSGVSVAKRLLVELTAAWLVVSAGWSFTRLGLPGLGDLHLGVVGPLVSVLWIVGVTNAVNLLDGLDGLAAGVVAIIAASMAVYSLFQVSSMAAPLLAAVTGACLGFLRHNREPARIFMGDAGSLTLGFLLGAASVLSSIKASAAVAILVPVLALGVPVIDTLQVMVARFFGSTQAGSRERIARMFRADRTHLHHLLEPLGRRRSAVVRWLYLMVVASCLMALVVAFTKSPGLGWALLLVEACAIAVIRQLGWARRVRDLPR
jgi:UDP-GlcNAc:undecaprenyl-phosphate GlcNAc-1-phosphate transferase